MSQAALFNIMESFGMGLPFSTRFFPAYLDLS